MPIYEYQCKKCGVIEAIQKFTDSPLVECPVCKTAGPEKIVSASAFHLKGSGWYKSDYATSKSNSSSEPAKESSTVAETPAKCSTSCKCH